jgi:hypothetical protein
MMAATLKIVGALAHLLRKKLQTLSSLTLAGSART